MSDLQPFYSKRMPSWASAAQAGMCRADSAGAQHSGTPPTPNHARQGSGIGQDVKHEVNSHTGARARHARTGVPSRAPPPLQAPRDPESSRSGLLKVMRHWAELDSQLQSAIVDLIDAALEEKGGSNDKE